MERNRKEQKKESGVVIHPLEKKSAGPGGIQRRREVENAAVPVHTIGV